MWVRRAAIRSVAPWAVVPEHVVARVEELLTSDESQSEEALDEAFTRFSTLQPALAEYLDDALGDRSDEIATALGWFLALSVWLAFEKLTDGSIETVTPTAVEGAVESLRLDEELRKADAAEVVDTEDIIAMEQPHLVKFLHDHIDSALEAHAHEVDVDTVHAGYRAVLIEVLTLSYAVAKPSHLPAFDAGEASA